MFTPFSFLAPTGGAGPLYGYRTDAYASYLKLAMPGSTFTDLISDGFSDVHADIVGSGTNIPYAITGSVSLNVQEKFPAEDYTTSIFTANGQWGAFQDTTISFGSSNFVVEGWWYPTQRFTMPPFWKTAIRHPNYYIDCSIGFPSSGTTNGRGRVMLNDVQYFSSNFTYSLNTWYHVAFVRSGNAKNFYFNGTRILNNTASAPTVSSNGAFIRVMRGENTTNDVASGNWQDFRIYVGTDKGYTGGTITTPNSIVEKL